ncbi:MAG TPA: 3-isopropylmalate dehydratase small subunit [Longimicrobiales bacterium]|nr:3-isopropylmalate dehydratase small subunit [Longimicrobiales bacterium]
MQPIRWVEGVVAPLDRADVDTDQIIPKQFLKRTARTGYGDALFHDWRYRPDGSPEPSFVLNDPEMAGARILVAGRNFGCGSSREHAAWALADYGFRAVVAPSFADIFRGNCLQSGLVPVELPGEAATRILRRAAAAPYRAIVDVEAGEIQGEDGVRFGFHLDPFHRRRLLEGLDDVDLTLEREAAIGAYERDRAVPPSWS